MSTLTFADTHNMVAFLEKPAESDGFHEIIDFLNANQIRYALTVNPTIYTSCIEQSDLHLEDAGGTDCLPTATIFEELARMGYEKPSQKLTFYKAFFSPQLRQIKIGMKELLKKDQVALDEDLARNLQAQLEAKLIEEERLARKQEEEANIALIESWDNTQAMMEADFELAQKLQTEEQGEITIEERSRLFVELMNKRKKHFAMLRAEEKELKSKSYEEIQKLFDNEMRRVNTFIPMDSKVVKSKKGIEESSKGTEDELESDKSKKAESSEEKAKGSRWKILGKKRTRKEKRQESSKRQRMKDDKETNEHEEVEVDDEAELKKHLVIVKDDDIAIDAIPLATKPPVIVEYKLLKDEDIDREDLETLWKLVKTKHGDTRPEDEHERVLWGDLKVMFEPDIKSDVWRNLQGYTVTI
ncbi:hypothetical protein Tco_1556453 [Tanacetum coccineum]